MWMGRQIHRRGPITLRMGIGRHSFSSRRVVESTGPAESPLPATAVEAIGCDLQDLARFAVHENPAPPLRISRRLYRKKGRREKDILYLIIFNK